MFESNDYYSQNSVFGTCVWKDSQIEEIGKILTLIFYKHVFCKIDEKTFVILFSDICRPNSSVNIPLSLEYIKHMNEDDDEELMDSFNFDYLIYYALSIKTLGAVNLAIRTLYYFRKCIYSYLFEHPKEEDLLLDRSSAFGKDVA